MPSNKVLTETTTSTVDYELRKKLISNQPLFSNFTPDDIDELVQVMQEVNYNTGDKIVTEGDFVDSILFIVKGRAKIFKKSFDSAVSEDIILGILEDGEPIGLTSEGFFSSHGKRTATVVALRETLLLRLDIKNFTNFIKKYPILDKKMGEFCELLLKLDFIKQTYPFCHLNNEIIYPLAQEIKEILLPPQTLIFSQDSMADSSYLIRSGQVEVFLSKNDGSEKSLAILESPQLLGEAALLTTNKRNASARTLSETRLFVLERPLLMKLIDTSLPFAESVVGFMLNRLRPFRCKNIKEHSRTTKDGQVVITLQNTALDQYYQLTKETWFIWQQLDGTQTVRDLTIAFFKQFKAFVPDMICGLLYNLAEMGFVNIPSLSVNLEIEDKPKTILGKLLNNIIKLSKKEVAFTRTDPWLTKFYRNGVWLFYTWPFQIALFVFIITGLIHFFNSYESIATSARLLHPSFLLFLFLLLPVSAITVFFHEAGHAFTAKKMGYKVQRIGLSWFLFMPVAFTDTSELWLANQRQRIAVDVAGVCVDFIVGACFSLLSGLVTSPEVAVFLWLFSLIIFFNAFKNLSPIREYDGYFILTDILDSYQLRKLSLKWIVNVLPNIFRHPELLKKHTAELYYWIACIVYLLVYIFLMFLIIKVLLRIFSVDLILGVSSTYFSIAFSLFILVTSVLQMRSEIKWYLKLSR